MKMLVLMILHVFGAWVAADWVWKKAGLPPFFSFGPRGRLLVGLGLLFALMVPAVFSEQKTPFPILLIQGVHGISLMVWLGLAAGLARPALMARKKEMDDPVLKQLYADLHPLFWVSAVIFILSGAVTGLFVFESGQQVLNTAAGLKLLVEAGLVCLALGMLIVSRLISDETGAPKKQSGLIFSFVGQTIVLVAALLVAVLMPQEETLGQGDLHQHNDPLQFHLTYQTADDGQTHMAVYVLHNRKRLSVDQLIFDVWPEEHHEEVSRAFDTICIDLNLGLDAWREVVAEKGMIDSIKGSEQESGLYTASVSLPPGLWHVRVHAEHGPLEGFRDYTLSISP